MPQRADQTVFVIDEDVVRKTKLLAKGIDSLPEDDADESSEEPPPSLGIQRESA